MPGTVILVKDFMKDKLASVMSALLALAGAAPT
jgi:hypothetical protein